MSAAASPQQLSPRMSKGTRRDGRDASVIPIELQPLRSSSHPDVVIDRPFWLEVVSVFQTLTSSSSLSKGSPSAKHHHPDSGSSPSGSPPVHDEHRRNASRNGEEGGTHDSTTPPRAGSSFLDERGAAVMIGSVPLTTHNVTYYETTSQLHRHLFRKYMGLVGLASPPRPPLSDDPNAVSPNSNINNTAAAVTTIEDQPPPPPLLSLLLCHRTAVDVPTLQQILTLVGADCAVPTAAALIKIIRYSTMDVRMLLRERSSSPFATLSARANTSGGSGGAATTTTTTTASHRDDVEIGGGGVESPMKQLRLTDSQVTTLLDAVATVIARRLVALRLFLHRGDPAAAAAAAAGGAITGSHHRSPQAFQRSADREWSPPGSMHVLTTNNNEAATTSTTCGAADSFTGVIEDVLLKTVSSVHNVLQRQAPDATGAGIATVGSFSCRSSVAGSSPLHARRQPRALSPPVSISQSVSSRVRARGGARSPPLISHHGGASSVVSSSRPLTPTRTSLLRSSPLVRTPPTDVNGRVRRATSPSASELLLGAVRGVHPRSAQSIHSSGGVPPLSRRAESPISQRATSPTLSSARRAPSPIAHSSSATLGYSTDHHQRHVAKAFGHVSSRVDCLHISAVLHDAAGNPFTKPSSPSSGAGSREREKPALHHSASSRRDSNAASSAYSTGVQRGGDSSQRRLTIASPSRPVASPTLHHHDVLGCRVSSPAAATSSSGSARASNSSPYRHSAAVPPPTMPTTTGGRGGGVLRSLAAEFSTALQNSKQR
jgi:hypothetical protein